jgi:hypothetical protein
MLWFSDGSNSLGSFGSSEWRLGTQASIEQIIGSHPWWWCLFGRRDHRVEIANMQCSGRDRAGLNIPSSSSQRLSRASCSLARVLIFETTSRGLIACCGPILVSIALFYILVRCSPAISYSLEAGRWSCLNPDVLQPSVWHGPPGRGPIWLA